MLVAEEFQDGWMRGLRLKDLQVKKGVAQKACIAAKRHNAVLYAWSSYTTLL